MENNHELRSADDAATWKSPTPPRSWKIAAFPPSSTIRAIRNIVIVLAIIALLLKVLAVGLTVTGNTSISPQSLDRRQGSVPTIQEAPGVIDMNGVYIRATRLNDGSLLAGYTHATINQLILLTARSTDEGRTWKHQGEVFRGDKATHDCDNAFVMQLPSGRILFAYRNHDKKNGRYTFFRISLSYSDDNGVTFKYLSTVDQRIMNGINGLWEPYMRIDTSGHIQCYFSAENGPPDQDGLMRISQDGGLTWGKHIIVSGTDIRSRDGMIGCAPTDDSGVNQICVFENTQSGYFTIDAVFSHNDGYTWSDRRRIYTPRSGTGCDGRPITAGAPQIYNVWGTLVMSFMTNEVHDSCNGYNGGDMKVIISTDQGQSWGKSYIVGQAPAHWGGIVDLGPNRFLALYERDGFGALSQVVTLE